MNLATEGWLFLPLYLVAAYHLYRLNYSKSFFMVFHEAPEKNENLKVRFGPVEFEIKDENDRNEEKFLDLFDWKKASVRRLLSWLLFAVSLYLLFNRLNVEVNTVTIAPPVICFFLMRSISVGHLLVPLGINFLITLSRVENFSTREISIFFVYGIFLILNLALIYPSEERLGGKLREWMQGKWFEVARVMAILMISFSTGIYLFQDMEFKLRPSVGKEEIQEQLKTTDRLNSALTNMIQNCLIENPDFLNRMKEHSEKLRELSGKTDVSQETWQETLNTGKALENKFQEKLSSAPAPQLTPELLEKMMEDARSRSKGELSPAAYRKLEGFLERARNYDGRGGSELVSEYREIKFGKGGYYREETEFDHSAGSEGHAVFLDQLKKSEERKRTLKDKLNKNIEELKRNSDEGLLSINKSLKDELDAIDSLSGEDRSMIERQLKEISDLQKDLLTRTTDPRLKEKILELEEETEHLLRGMTPHMNAADKSQLARKLQNQQRKLTAAGREVRKEISQKLQREDKANSSTGKSVPTNWIRKIVRFGVFALGAALFFWFMKLLGKKGVKRVRGIPEGVKEELEVELAAIKKMKLSPREEVIHTYNVFHDGLKTLIFTSETPPSCIVYEGIKVAEPELAKPAFTVTETFARTFYGDKEVTLPELKSFRSEITKIFSFFDISG